MRSPLPYFSPQQYVPTDVDAQWIQNTPGGTLIYAACVQAHDDPWDGLVATLRLLQKGKALSQETSLAFAASILSAFGGAMSLESKELILRSKHRLASSLCLLRLVEHRALSAQLLQSALSLLGMRAEAMPWVQSALDCLALGGYISQVRSCENRTLLCVLLFASLPGKTITK